MKKFEANFDSLHNFKCPDWFLDAKFGIWSHWGPQSVPMCGDWYARYMYIQGSPQYNYHLRHYGHPSKFGYKDICKLWKAEKFDPDYLMDLYYKAGARYFVAQAMHHDHFFNYNSKLNKNNSVNIGPEKDICMLWKNAAEKKGMRFGLTEHLGASFSWWRVNKLCDHYGPYKGVPYDGNDPEYKDFYLDNAEENEVYAKDDNPEKPWYAIQPWYTTNAKFHKYWLDVMNELVEKFEPDLLYSDGGLPFSQRKIADKDVTIDEAENDESFKIGLEAVAALYNKSIEKHGENQAVYNQKNKAPEIYKIGVLDIEKSQLPDILPEPWQTDTCIGNWFYDAKANFKKPAHIIEMLVDIISKNGTMLLNILQRPDGSLDEEAIYILEELAKWFEICSEGVYGTRPWKVSGEGDTKVLIKGFQEDKVGWTSRDIRFTKKDDNVYAFLLNIDENRVVVINSFDYEKIDSVELLGFGKVDFVNEFGKLIIKLPQELPTEYTNCLKIKLV